MAVPIDAIDAAIDAFSSLASDSLLVIFGYDFFGWSDRLNF